MPEKKEEIKGISLWNDAWKRLKKNRMAMFGGIDKRVLARSKSEIDAMVERILPPMRARGGYIPTCDHGVPEEVPYENYCHYRRRCLELGG